MSGTTPPARSAPVTAGALAGRGAAPVVGAVQTAPTPRIVPAELAAVLDPLPGPDGAPTDWFLNPARLLTQPAPSRRALREAFTRWRRQYLTEATLTDAATVAAFVDWAHNHTDVSALRALTAGGRTRIDPATATRVAKQALAAGQACRSGGEQGLGLATPTRAGLIRGFRLTDPPTLILATEPVTVTAGAQGLQLTFHPEPVTPTRLHTAEPATASRATVTGWRLDRDGVTAVTAEGPLPLGESAAAKLLALLAPGVAVVRVHPVPLTSVFAPLLTDLPDLARLAARTARPLLITTGR